MSRVERRMSKVEGRKSRAASRGSQVEGQKSRGASRGSHVEGHSSRVRKSRSRVKSKGSEYKGLYVFLSFERTKYSYSGENHIFYRVLQDSIA